MKTSRFALLFMGITLASCETLDDIRMENTHVEEIKQEDPVVETDPDIWVSAIEVTDGYDWRRDTAFCIRNCNLILYKNGEQVLSFPAGPGMEVGTDPDQHFISGGHIYTEYHDLFSRNVIKKDGEQLFEFQSREHLRCILVSGTDVFALSEEPYGGTFSLRVNGESLITVKGGIIHSDLYTDKGHMYFSYHIPGANSTDKWFIVEDGNEYEVPVPAGTRMMDVRVINGRTATLYCDKEGGNCFFRIGDDAETALTGASFRLDEGRFINNSNKTAVCGMMHRAGSTFRYPFIFIDGKLTSFYTSDNVDFYMDQSTYAYVRQSEDGRLASHSYISEYTTADESYYFFSPGCAAFYKGHSHILLTPYLKGEYPVIWNDGEMEEFKIDGYLTAIDLSLPN